MRVGVLLGGWSAEREVSLVSGKSVVQGLIEMGYTPIEIDPDSNPKVFIDQVLSAHVDIVFNALHGKYGEDGRLVAILDLLKIPYTHSGVLASSVAMDKVVAKKVFQGLGIDVPEGHVYSAEDIQKHHVIPVPYVVKPLSEGSSVGVSLIQSDDDLKNWVHNPLHGTHYLVEEYIPGREVHVGVINGKAIGAIELKSHNNFYDYQAKYVPGYCDHIMPAKISQEIESYLLDHTEKVFHALKCRGISRADWRYDDTKPTPRLVLLEINTHPGFTPLSTTPEIAAHYGISFNAIIQLLLDGARYDY